MKSAKYVLPAGVRLYVGGEDGFCQRRLLPRKAAWQLRADPIAVAVPFRFRRLGHLQHTARQLGTRPFRDSASTGPLAGWSAGSVSTVDTSAAAGGWLYRVQKIEGKPAVATTFVARPVYPRSLTDLRQYPSRAGRAKWEHRGLSALSTITEEHRGRAQQKM
jgi:hypothetical protein